MIPGFRDRPWSSAVTSSEQKRLLRTRAEPRSVPSRMSVETLVKKFEALGYSTDFPRPVSAHIKSSASQSLLTLPIRALLRSMSVVDFFLNTALPLAEMDHRVSVFFEDQGIRIDVVDQPAQLHQIVDLIRDFLASYLANGRDILEGDLLTDTYNDFVCDTRQLAISSLARYEGIVDVPAGLVTRFSKVAPSQVEEELLQMIKTDSLKIHGLPLFRTEDKRTGHKGSWIKHDYQEGLGIWLQFKHYALRIRGNNSPEGNHFHVDPRLLDLIPFFLSRKKSVTEETFSLRYTSDEISVTFPCVPNEDRQTLDDVVSVPGLHTALFLYFNFNSLNSLKSIRDLKSTERAALPWLGRAVFSVSGRRFSLFHFASGATDFQPQRPQYDVSTAPWFPLKLLNFHGNNDRNILCFVAEVLRLVKWHWSTIKIQDDNTPRRVAAIPLERASELLSPEHSTSFGKVLDRLREKLSQSGWVFEEGDPLRIGIPLEISRVADVSFLPKILGP